MVDKLNKSTEPICTLGIKPKLLNQIYESNQQNSTYKAKQDLSRKCSAWKDFDP